MKTHNFYKIKILCLSLVVALSFVFAFAFIGFYQVSAQTPVAETDLVLPKTNIEYHTVSEPIDVYSDNELTAIAQADNTLTVYKNGSYTVVPISFTAIQQVKKFSNDLLLVSDNGSIYMVDLKNNDKSLLMFNNEHVGGNYFDISDDYLITAYSTQLIIYTLKNDGTLSIIDKDSDSIPGGVDANSPVCIHDLNTYNNTNIIFYVSSSGELCMRSTDNLNRTETIKDQNNNNVKPYKMVASNDAVYYILSGDNNVYRVYTEENKKESLTIDCSDKYDLGCLENPRAISFRNGNLIISDFSGSIQEFKINGDKLEFTGFAIAKEKTAFNRIGKSVVETERYGDTLAVLDEYKLSVINVEDNFDAYDKANFTDFFKEDLGGQMPQSFALGTKTVLLSFGHGSAGGSLRLLNLEDKSLSDPINPAYTVRDVHYQSGYYYVMLDDSNDNLVYRFSENEIDLSSENLMVKSKNTHCQKFTVDVFGALYLYDNSSATPSLIKHVLGDNGYTTEALPFVDGVIKLSTDLTGGLFALKNDSIWYLNKNGAWQKKEIDVIENGLNAKSFALNYDKKQVFIVFENSEYVVETTALNNISIDTLTIPSNYKTTDENAKPITDFKTYKAKNNANVYCVNIGEDICYKGLINTEEEYAFLCEIQGNDGADKTATFYALAGQTNLVIINANEVIETTPQINSSVSRNAYITTQANVYYLPIITPDGDYALTLNSSSLDRIRLAKFTEIYPEGKLSFLGKEYYYATVTVDGANRNGFIPVSFTTEVLSENFSWESYTIEHVNKTAVYSDATLETSTGVVLSDGTEVRILENANGVAKILYLTENGYVQGYVSAKDIKNVPNVAVRNILIVLAVAASVCGTTTYFVLRRKDYK